MIRRIKNKERAKAGNIYCSYCRPGKVNAIWRIKGFQANHQSGYSCEKHYKELKIKSDRLDKLDNQSLSEADYQTWIDL